MMKGRSGAADPRKISVSLGIASGLWAVAFGLVMLAISIAWSTAESSMDTRQFFSADLPLASALAQPEPITQSLSMRGSQSMKTLSHKPTSGSGQSLLSYAELEMQMVRLQGPDKYGLPSCPEKCGCAETKKDCPQHYTVEELEASATVSLDTPSIMALKERLEKRHVEASQSCIQGSGSTSTGGWCLGNRNPHPIKDGGGTIALKDGRKWVIPYGHVDVSKAVAGAMVEMFQAEGVTSVSDYGAGVGQYGRYFKEKIPEIIYRGFDGAGDIEAYTHGFVSFSDFTLPLDHPKSDWVMSLEVGEHIPSKFEGVFLRNLHRHNCKGIILSWAALGQGGYNHINCHSNEYIVGVLNKLGYTQDMELTNKLRNPQGNWYWFVNSIMAFRRNEAVC